MRETQDLDRIADLYMQHGDGINNTGKDGVVDSDEAWSISSLISERPVSGPDSQFWEDAYQFDFLLTRFEEQISSFDGEEGISVSDMELLKQVLKTPAHLTGPRFTGQFISDQSFSEANLENADLRFSKLHRIDLRGANLKGADLSHSKLTVIDMRGADLSNANLSSTSFFDVRYDETTVFPLGFNPADHSGLGTEPLI
ncbi:MAG: pentapeptide repeat-containing protein [Granulosicoccus sp.]